MLGDMMEKLRKMQEQVENTKKKLANQEISTEKEGIKIRINGLREVQEIEIAPSLFEDQEMLQELLITAVNRAIKEADTLYDREMAGTAQSIMPNLPGM
jgi:DNA-binding YbaB/EbfC family protein